MPFRTPSSFEDSTQRFGKKYKALWGLALATSLDFVAGGCSTENWKPFDGRLKEAGSMVGTSSIPDASADAPSTLDGSATDDTASGDATNDASTIDGADVGCSCAIVEAGVPVLSMGELAMPCYCAKMDWHDNYGARPNCPSFDEVMTCPDAGLRFSVTRYTNCNLIAVNYDVHNAVDSRFYDATTHELVGAMRGTDFVVSSCGQKNVNVIRSGVTPGADCEIAGWVRPCDPGDPRGGGSDANGQ